LIRVAVKPSTRAAFSFIALVASLWLLAVHDARAADATLALVGEPQILFDAARDGCDAIDMPDINARAFRDANGDIVFFGLHLTNRVLRGKDLSHLAIDCHVVLGSGFDPDPAHYNDRNFITATWTADGRDIAALVHHEYHADTHGRCAVKTSLGCWYNTILAYRSSDGGADFVKATPLVVAAAPFTQDVGQGRHRGFFNPSNIFSDGTYEYFFAATTGWDGQDFGACLFRSAHPQDSGSWRAYDGRNFAIRYSDPYGAGATPVAPCMPIAPFIFPVGAVVRVQNSGLWIAVFQAARNEGVFPVDGFYYATATDLRHWSAPRLLRAGKTLYSDLCSAGGGVIAYPSLLDDKAQGRNFDNVGDDAYLYFAVIKVDNCTTGNRLLMRQKVLILPSADTSQ
jgi:hypothetical protein